MVRFHETIDLWAYDVDNKLNDVMRTSVISTYKFDFIFFTIKVKLNFKVDIETFLQFNS